MRQEDRRRRILAIEQEKKESSVALHDDKNVPPVFAKSLEIKDSSTDSLNVVSLSDETETQQIINEQEDVATSNASATNKFKKKIVK